MSSEGMYEAESLPQPADDGPDLYGRDPAHFDVVLLEFYAASDTAGTGHGHGRRRDDHRRRRGYISVFKETQCP